MPRAGRPHGHGGGVSSQHGGKGADSAYRLHRVSAINRRQVQELDVTGTRVDVTAIRRLRRGVKVVRSVRLVAGTNHRRGERICSYRAPITEGEREYAHTGHQSQKV
eukprot:8712516-Pyramimonas_sp.AAC.1